jgi:hypothetical protein
MDQLLRLQEAGNLSLLIKGVKVQQQHPPGGIIKLSSAWLLATPIDSNLETLSGRNRKEHPMHNVIATSDRFINSVRAGPREGSPVILLRAMSLDLTYWDGLRDCPELTTSWLLTGQVMADLADSMAG